MDKKEMMEVIVWLNEELGGKLFRMTKKELIEKFAESALKAHVLELRLQTEKETTKAIQNEYEKRINDYKSKLKGAEADNDILQTKLDKAESYVEQGRAMIEAIMERWYEYDA